MQNSIIIARVFPIRVARYHVISINFYPPPFNFYPPLIGRGSSNKGGGVKVGGPLRFSYDVGGPPNFYPPLIGRDSLIRGGGKR